MVERGTYLYRWHLDESLRPAEEALVERVSHSGAKNLEVGLDWREDSLEIHVNSDGREGSETGELASGLTLILRPPARLRPDCASPYLYLGETYTATKRLKQAIEALEKYVSLMRDPQEVSRDLSRAFDNSNKREIDTPFGKGTLQFGVQPFSGPLGSGFGSKLSPRDVDRMVAPPGLQHRYDN